VHDASDVAGVLVPCVEISTGTSPVLDVIAGLTVSIVAARRDFGVNNPGFGSD